MGRADDDQAERGELLAHLRHALRKCSTLAENFAQDPLVGAEARSMLGRLTAIRGELDALQAFKPEWRHALNDPFWSDNRRSGH